MTLAGPMGLVKRSIDLAVVAISAVATLPVLAVLAVLCRVVHGSPVLHRSTRVGFGERPFTILKLRTMTNERGGDGALLPDADRLTRLGTVLRAASLDELPQLWNVVRGEMSLVGPRPLPEAYLPRYTEEERVRHQARPGITGLAQVRGRNELTWDERLAMDVWYVRHHSTWLDVRILARTAFAVVRRTGISAEGEATMHELRPELGRDS